MVPEIQQAETTTKVEEVQAESAEAEPAVAVEETQAAAEPEA